MSWISRIEQAIRCSVDDADASSPFCAATKARTGPRSTLRGASNLEPGFSGWIPILMQVFPDLPRLTRPCEPPPG